jgi:hypothetical protein
MHNSAINATPAASHLPSAMSLVHAQHGVYRLRPDIFVKATSERLYLSHRDSHYILRLGSELIQSVGDFIDCIDGEQSLIEILGRLPNAHQRAMLKFLRFLLDKGMAFQLVGGAFPAELYEVRETLDYLSEYCSDPVERYYHFVSRRIMLVGAGYALTSAIKTLARIGIRQLAVLHVPGLGHHGFEEQELRQGFEEAKVRADAELRYFAEGSAVDPELDVILHCHERPDVSWLDRMARSAPALQLLGLVGGSHLFITDDAADAADIIEGVRSGTFEPASISPTASLIVGATCALALFDQLAGIRPAAVNSYRHYDLRAQGSMQTAQRCALIPLGDLPLATTAAGGLATDWPRLAEAPLFPLGPMRERTEVRGYIKVYTVVARAHTQRTLPRVALAAAGFTKQGCQQQLVLALAGVHGLGLSCCSADEQACLGHAANLLRQAQILAAGVHFDSALDPVHPPLGPREEYIAFCVSTSFDLRLQWHDVTTGDAVMPRCLRVRAGTVAAFMPYAIEPAAVDREALLFSLYVQLWARQCGETYDVQRVLVPAGSLPQGLQP